MMITVRKAKFVRQPAQAGGGQAGYAQARLVELVWSLSKFVLLVVDENVWRANLRTGHHIAIAWSCNVSNIQSI